MEILVTVVHVVACIILILVVLLQAGKGADMGAVFGGASSTIFGSSGAGNFLTRLTTAAAVVFMATSLTLTWTGQRMGGSSIMPESGLPKGGIEEPAAGTADEEAAAVADSMPPPAPGDGVPAGDTGDVGGTAPAAPAEPAAPAAPDAAPAEPAPVAP